MDLLEQGREPAAGPASRLRLPRWAAPLAAAGALVAVAAASRAGWLPGQLPAPAAAPTPPAAAALPDPPAAPRPAVRVPPPATLYLAGPRLMSWPVPGGQPRDLGVGAASGVAVLDSGAAVAVVEGGARRLPGGRDLGPAVAAFPGGGDTVWLVTGPPGARRARLVGVDGAVRLPDRAVPSGYDVAGAVDAWLVLGPGPAGPAGPVAVWDPVVGRLVRTVTGSGVVLDVRGGAVAWATCGTAACPPRVGRVDAGPDAELPALPPDVRPVGPPVLAPDAVHWAQPTTRPGGAPGLAVVVGHLPLAGNPAARAAPRVVDLTASDPGRSGRPGPVPPLTAPPRLAYTAGGWLYLVAGGRGYALSTYPHEPTVLPGRAPGRLVGAS